jgi:hypothetical protein
VAVGRGDDGPLAALRLSLGARDVVEALSTVGGEAAVIDRARRALAIAGRAAGA